MQALHLQQGDTVVEIGCGTGLNFSLLQDRIGPKGSIIGVDMTDAMLDEARGRIVRNGWSNVELIHCDAGQYEFPRNVNGFLSTFALTLVPQFDDVIRRGANERPVERRSLGCCIAMKLMNETQRLTPFVATDRAAELTNDREIATVVDAQVRGRLADCRFAFFVNQVTWHFDDGVLTLEGRVRTEHLKCALDSLLRDIAHIEQIVNRVDVVSATGVSRIEPR